MPIAALRRKIRSFTGLSSDCRASAGTTNCERSGARAFGIPQITNRYQISRETGVHFSRCYRSALHGFISLMQSGYYANKSVDAEKSFRFLIRGYAQWLASLEEESIQRREEEKPADAR